MTEQERETGEATMDRSGAGRRPRGMGLLFVSLMAMILLSPLLHAGVMGRVILPVVFVGTLIFGIYASSDSGKHRLIAIALGLPMIAGYVISEVTPAATNISSMMLTFGVPFFLYVTYRLLVFVQQATRVGQNELYAAASVYLMFGITWAGFYGLLNYFDPDAFTNLAGQPKVWDTIIYFSFVTLTTLGYGDVAPASELARHLAILEAVTGVLTLSFLIARIVSSYSKED